MSCPIIPKLDQYNLLSNRHTMVPQPGTLSICASENGGSSLEAVIEQAFRTLEHSKIPPSGANIDPGQPLGAE